MKSSTFDYAIHLLAMGFKIAFCCFVHRRRCCKGSLEFSEDRAETAQCTDPVQLHCVSNMCGSISGYRKVKSDKRSDPYTGARPHRLSL